MTSALLISILVTGWVLAAIGWRAAWVTWKANEDLWRASLRVLGEDQRALLQKSELSMAAHAYVDALGLLQSADPARFREWHVEMPKTVGDAYVRMVKAVVDERPGRYQ